MEAENLEAEVKKIIQCFTKNPKRKFGQIYLQQKSLAVEQLKVRLVKIVNVTKSLEIKKLIVDLERIITSKKNLLVVKEGSGINSEINTEINSEINSEIDISNLFEPNMEFNLQDFDKLIPSFDGNRDNVLDFLKTAQAYHDLLNAAGQGQLVEKLIAFKIKKRASLQLKLQQPQPGSFADFHKLIQKLFGPRLNLMKLNAELARTVQMGSVTTFTKRLEELQSEFLIYHSIAGTQGAVNALIETQILNQFLTGLKPELQNSVLAAKSATFLEATHAALDAEVVVTAQRQINHLRQSRSRNNDNRFRNNAQNINNQNRNNFSRNQNQFNNPSDQNNSNSNYNNRQNNSKPNSNYNRQNNFNSNSNRRNNYNSNNNNSNSNNSNPNNNARSFYTSRNQNNNINAMSGNAQISHPQDASPNLN